MSKKQEEEVQRLAVVCGSASLGEGSASIGIVVSKKKMDTNEGEDKLLKAQLDVTLTEEEPEQQTLEGFEAAKVSGVANTGKLSLDTDEFGLRLSFSGKDVSGDELQSLAGKPALLIFRKAGDASEVVPDDPNQQTMGE